MVLLDHTLIDALSTLIGNNRSRKTSIATWVRVSTFPKWEEATVKQETVFAGLVMVMDYYKIDFPNPAFH